jgi:hypothetical protein
MARYVAMVFAMVAALGGLCLTINAVVDPLWYFRGNILTGVNYAFNERLAKINRLLPHQTDYDCLILGSSTAALLPERMISGYRCFNMGFSGGVVSEFLLYATYLRARGVAPKLLIVAVDEFDFEGPTVPPNVPQFILDGDDPPSFWRSYLSLDALDFSIRTFRGDYPNHRMFDRDFRSHIIPRRRPYRPPHIAARKDPGEFHGERAASYVELRHVFPLARAIGFVTPTSAWTVAQLEVDGRLELYLESLHQIAAAFNEFLDFGVPSDITASTQDTYDGLHYVDSVNDRVAAALISGDAAPGINWHSTSDERIFAVYKSRIDRLVGDPVERPN